MKKTIINARKFVEENRDKNLPSPIQINENNPYVIGIDYGFFLKNMINFIIEEGGIVDEKEKTKVYTLIYLYFGISFKQTKLNFAANVLMKNLFGNIFGITTYRVFALKGNVFYPVFVENGFGEYYKLNMFYIKKRY